MEIVKGGVQKSALAFLVLFIKRSWKVYNLSVILVMADADYQTVIHAGVVGAEDGGSMGSNHPLKALE